MADFRTLALIFAVCFLADFLYSLFTGKNEQVTSEPPPTDNVHIEDFKGEDPGHQPEHHSHDAYDQLLDFDESEVEEFEEPGAPVHQHTNGMYLYFLTFYRV